MMHELIDREYPVCLYCGKQCDIFFSGSAIPSSAQTIEHESLCCVACKETFVIDWFQNLEGDTHYVGFDFTCKNFIVKVNYAEDYFELWQNNKYVTAIPPFKVDFSDKEKLYQKIKTYIIFS